VKFMVFQCYRIAGGATRYIESGDAICAKNASRFISRTSAGVRKSRKLTACKARSRAKAAIYPGRFRKQLIDAEHFT
jgi:hypothetical protein